jgi:tRNA(Ile)-lysidine synthase
VYHVSVHRLAERVLGNIRREELLRAGDRVGVAVSGGIDSVALLRLLLGLRHELGIVVSVVHFNHKLRGVESDEDQQFVAALARQHGLQFYSESEDVAQHAIDIHSGVEAAARELRYEFFGRLLGANEAELPQTLEPESGPQLDGTSEAAHLLSGTHSIRLNKIATGHTLDDQAETVLMRLIRGTGLRGLGGIFPRIVVENEENEGQGEIVRPLLAVRRRELEQYVTELKQPWREDATNTDFAFTRNRVRKLVIPLLEKEFNPSVTENFSELAEIARDEEDYWENEISGWLGTVVQWSEPEWVRGLPGFSGAQNLVQISPAFSEPVDEGLLARLNEAGSVVMNASVSRPWLLTEPRAVQRRVLKAIGEQAGIPLEFKHIEEILRFTEEEGPRGKELSLPLGWKMVREPEAVVFVTPDLRRRERVSNYEYPLPVPGRAFVPELDVVIEALRVDSVEEGAEYNPQQLIRADLLAGPLKVRNWRSGDRFWPAHTKAPKKVKELLQKVHIEQPLRQLWPVILSGKDIIWMRSFPVPASCRAKPGQAAILIRETPSDDEQRI